MVHGAVVVGDRLRADDDDPAVRLRHRDQHGRLPLNVILLPGYLGEEQGAGGARGARGYLDKLLLLKAELMNLQVSAVNILREK